MLKTTIPTLEIKTTGIDLSLVQTVLITIKQQDYTVIKSNDDIEVDNGVISVYLKQTEYSKLKSGGISISISATGYDGDVYVVKTEWAKFGSRTNYVEGSSGVAEYDILPTIQAVEDNMESGKLVDALAIKEVFTSVSNGKELIASAITDKGVQTGATDTFATMAGNIGMISVGGEGNCPFTSPYLFNFGGTIPFSTSNGAFSINFPVNKIKRLIIKKFVFSIRRGSTSNSSGLCTVYLIGVKKGQTEESTITSWYKNASGSTNSTVYVVNITSDEEIDISEFEEVKYVRIGKMSASGTLISISATIDFQAHLYF